jgi:hypothetical protein
LFVEVKIFPKGKVQINFMNEFGNENWNGDSMDDLTSFVQKNLKIN